LDYWVRPVTVSLTGGRRLRGFVGWALYRAFETSMLDDMWRVLSVAEAFGVGTTDR
jgi:CRISPR/Cas system endoribonuclease Cas6 (RAMP superfamily)